MSRRHLLVLCVLAAACTAGGRPVGQREGALAAGLPEVERGKIASSTVPVLLPRGVALTGGRLIVERTYTALHLPLPGATVSLHATRIAHRHPGVRPDPGPRRLRGGTGHVTMNEGIWTASWVEDGVAYALDLECATAADPRCADERAVLELAQELAEVGP
jgi:anti-sigma factor RsiW